ncbi:MAG: hypothetical protein CFE44_20040 [Burkholderiales bacterium PBB4]|nr:MAG: hypothetical protein CFE44_20040 [Burkholderiales bacterium PBB4]
MIEDMRMRKLKPKTQQAYIRAVRKFAKFLGRSPDTASDEDLRRLQLHLIDLGTSPITLNATIVGLNFLFEVTLGRPEAMAKMKSVRVPQKLACGTGLRVGEVVALKICDKSRLTVQCLARSSFWCIAQLLQHALFPVGAEYSVHGLPCAGVAVDAVHLSTWSVTPCTGIQLLLAWRLCIDRDLGKAKQPVAFARQSIWRRCGNSPPVDLAPARTPDTS